MCSDTEAPDYGPMADASEEAARIGAELGYSQLDLAKQQYYETKPLLDQVVNQQMATADQSAAQGQDYYDYLRSYRPTERSMMYESLGLTGDEIGELESMYNDNQRSFLQSDSYMAGREAEIADLYKALGMTPREIDSTITRQGTVDDIKGYQPYTGSTSSALGKAMAKMDQQLVQQMSGQQIIEQIKVDNPEYAEVLNNLTEAQKELLAEQIDASTARESANLDYNDRLSELMTLASTRRETELKDYDTANKADAAEMTMSPDELYNLRRSEIEPMVDRAIADSQGAYTRNLNQAIRQGLRYGAASPQMVGQVGSIGLQQAQMQAASANAARQGGIQDVRNRTGQRLGLRQSNLQAKNQAGAVDWAKRLDAAGLVKGLPGASTGAYGLAVSAGNSAGQNAMAAGNNYMQGMSTGAGTINQGIQTQMSGLSNIMDSQTSIYNTSTTANSEMLGAAVGMAGGMMSDIRVKENIVLVGTDESTGLNLYEFNYVWDDSRRYRGVMAQDVLDVMPLAVAMDDDGFFSVDYDMLGIEMVEV